MSTVAQRIARINLEADGVWSQYGIDSWERARLSEWAELVTLSPKQMAALERIEVKVFGDDD